MNTHLHEPEEGKGRGAVRRVPDAQQGIDLRLAKRVTKADQEAAQERQPDPDISRQPPKVILAVQRKFSSFLLDPYAPVRTSGFCHYFFKPKLRRITFLGLGNEYPLVCFLSDIVRLFLLKI